MPLDVEKLFQESSTLVDDAVRRINKRQTGELPVLKTRYDHLNDIALGGLTAENIYVAVARPSHGKTHFLHNLIEDIFNKELNPDANPQVLLFNWEMATSNILLRKLKEALGKPMREILDNPFTKDEVKIAKEVVDSYRDSRITKVDRALTPQEYEATCEYFAQTHADKSHCVICTDHMGIGLGDNKTKTMSEFMEVQNRLKKKYTNVLFVDLAQLKRDIEGRWRDENSNPRSLIPNSSDVYNSDAMQQFADMIIGLVIPYNAGMEEYASVSREYNKHLEEHFVNHGDSSQVRLKGRNRVYHHFIKVRMADDHDVARNYCVYLNEEDKEIIDTSALSEKDSTQDPIEDFNF